MCSPFTERGALCIECSSSTTSDRNESPKIEKELGKEPLRVAVHFFAQVGTDYSALCSAVSEALKGLNTTESRLNELHFKNTTPCAFVSSSECVWSAYLGGNTLQMKLQLLSETGTICSFAPLFFANVTANFVVLLLDLHLAAAAVVIACKRAISERRSLRFMRSRSCCGRN